MIEERRKGAEDLLRFTVPIPALNNSPQLKEFFRVSLCDLPSPGKLPCTASLLTSYIPDPSPAELCLLQGGEVTRPSEVFRDLQILPPPLIPTPPPDEARLLQPLPTERRGQEELEVPGISGSGKEQALLKNLREKHRGGQSYHPPGDGL